MKRIIFRLSVAVIAIAFGACEARTNKNDRKGIETRGAKDRDSADRDMHRE